MTATDNMERPDQEPFPAGQDEVEDGDRLDNLGDADTLADLSDPAIDGEDAMDDQPDGDRQLTTESDALDTGLNDSDLGADVAGLPPTRQTGAHDREGYAGLEPDAAPAGGTGDRATGITDLRG